MTRSTTEPSGPDESRCWRGSPGALEKPGGVGGWLNAYFVRIQVLRSPVWGLDEDGEEGVIGLCRLEMSRMLCHETKRGKTGG